MTRAGARCPAATPADRRIDRVCRRRLPAGRDPLRHGARSRAGHADRPSAQAGDRGDRGSELYREGGIDPKAIVRASWRDLRRRQARPGRLDDHPAAGPRPLHQAPKRRAQAQDRRGASGRRGERPLLEGLDPHPVPELGPLRDQRRPDRRGCPGGRRDVLLQARAPADAAQADLLAGLPQARSDYNPLVHPRLAGAPRRGVAGDAGAGIHQRPPAGRVPSAAGSDCTVEPCARPRAVRLRPGAPRARASLRARDGEARRAEGRYDDPAASEADAQQAVDACAVCSPGGGPASALASVDPSSGAIVALASSQGYSPTSQFNFAAQRIASPARRSRRPC